MSFEVCKKRALADMKEAKRTLKVARASYDVMRRYVPGSRFQEDQFGFNTANVALAEATITLNEAKDLTTSDCMLEMERLRQLLSELRVDVVRAEPTSLEREELLEAKAEALQRIGDLTRKLDGQK